VSLYQQRPTPEEGAIFRRAWFKSYGGPIECPRTIFSLDCAFKSGKENDFSVIAVISEAKTGFHVRLVSRGRWEFPELKRQAVALADIWRPNAVLIEDAASGQSLIQALKSETRLPILPVRPMGDKVSRAHAVSPLVESGRVCVPDAAPWLADFLEEVTSFPAAPHDDMVDALTQALNWMRGSYFDSAALQQIGRSPFCDGRRAPARRTGFRSDGHKQLRSGSRRRRCGRDCGSALHQSKSVFADSLSVVAADFDCVVHASAYHERSAHATSWTISLRAAASWSESAFRTDQHCVSTACLET
jgi:predicted phage terminase large subunit-like protein